MTAGPTPPPTRQPRVGLLHTSCADELVHRSHVRQLVACVLQNLFGSLDEKLPSDPACLTAFHSVSTPSVFISVYFERVAKFGECSAEVLVEAIMNINRILFYQPAFHINNLNIHRLIAASLLVTAKFKDERHYNNAHYAKIGGLEVKEMNYLEAKFLVLMNFDLHIKSEAVASFWAELHDATLHPGKCTCREKSCACTLCTKAESPPLLSAITRVASPLPPSPSRLAQTRASIPSSGPRPRLAVSGSLQLELPPIRSNSPASAVRKP